MTDRLTPEQLAEIQNNAYVFMGTHAHITTSHDVVRLLAHIASMEGELESEKWWHQGALNAQRTAIKERNAAFNDGLEAAAQLAQRFDANQYGFGDDAYGFYAITPTLVEQIRALKRNGSDRK